MLEVPKTEAIKSLRDKSREHEEVLAHSLPYITAVNDGVIMMRDGDLIASFTVEGINADTADTYRVKDIAEVLSRLIAQEPDNVAFYIQRISHLTKPQMKPVDGEGFTAEIDKRWQRFLQSNGMRERINLITLVIRHPRVSGFFARFSKDNRAPLSIELLGRIRAFRSRGHRYLALAGEFGHLFWGNRCQFR